MKLKSLIAHAAPILMLSFLTVSSVEDGLYLRSDWASRTPDSVRLCSQSEMSELTLGRFFEIEQASHFYEVIDSALQTQPESSRQLQSLSQLLHDLNEEILNPGGEASYAKIESWMRAYPGADRFRRVNGSSRSYDLNGFYSFVEQDIHRFFHRLLSDTLLPQNVWVVRAPFSERILSLGVRLGEKTWARIGIFPQQWHLHIFKSEAKADKSRPLEHLPLQVLSLRLLSPEKLEILDGAGQVRMVAKAYEELNLTPYCEWIAGESRRNQQFSHRALKGL